MSDGITDAERERRRILNKFYGDELSEFLAVISTTELVEELSKREGVALYPVPTTKHQYLVLVQDYSDDAPEEGGAYSDITEMGKARILVVKE